MTKKETSSRLANYDLVKVLAIFMVVAVHMLNVVDLMPPGDVRAYGIHEVVRTFLLTSNGLFFMVSGRFLLEHYDGRAWRFYWKRLVKIGIPVFAASLFYYIYVYGRNGMGPAFWKAFVLDFWQSHIQGYFWFVFALAGFYLAVPFLAPMFGSLKRKELWLLFGVSLAYFFLQNLYQIFGLEMVFTSYPFYSWIFYCMLGYLLDHLELSARGRKGFLAAGAGAFLISAWEICFWERENPALHNYSVTMILMTAALYLGLTSWGKRMPDICAAAVRFLSVRSFYIYLMHGLTQILLAARVGDRAAGWGMWFFLSAASFCFALVIGMVLEWLYRPVSGWLCGLFGGQKESGVEG